ncbi:MAG: hypothetical protein WBA89_23670 [Microcoleus sp.]
MSLSCIGNGEWGMGNGEWGMGNGEWALLRNFAPGNIKMYSGNHRE